MNHRQEIAAWFFGGLIALTLALTGHGIWALIVATVVTILSLRDRQKKQKSISSSAPSESDKP
jgi:hypothetical protein